MRRWLLLLAVAAAVAPAVVPLPARADLEPGNWEISAATAVPGIAEPMAMTQTRCLTAEDARDPTRLFRSQPGRCEFTRRNDTGSVFTFEIECPGGTPPMRGSGSVRYGRESLEGELELNAAPLLMRSRITGRRLGAC